MQMKARDLAEVVGELRDRELSGDASERRRAARVAVEAPLTVWVVAQGAVRPAVTSLSRDLSCGGIGMLQSFEAAPGSHFAVGLPRGRHGPLVMLCRSVFCKEAVDGLYMVGAEFIQPVERSPHGSTPAPATSAPESASAPAA